MPIDDEGSTGKATTSDEGDNLLRHRMRLLELDPAAIQREYPEIFAELQRHCLSCRDRAPCVVDLRRDPESLVWEAYCPNSGTLLGLVTLTEANS
jgi:hypothetical protein